MYKLINELGEIIIWPKKPDDKDAVIKYLATNFESNNIYVSSQML